VKRFFSIFTGIMLLSATTLSGQDFSAGEKKEIQRKITEACRHAWKGYLTYANGYDALKPVSCRGHNWYGTSFLMTPVDAFDTFILLGMKKEAKEAKSLILSKLSFDVDQEVQLFEVNIRLVGGLISAFELSGDKRFRELALDLGRRLLPAFNSPTGMPYRFVNLRTGKCRDAESNPAEIGTYLLEFGKLTAWSGDSTFYRAAKKAAMEVFRRRSDLDLVGTIIDVNTGEWKNFECQIGARIDSYYEYLYKSWLLFGDTECYEAWKLHNKAILKYMFTKEKSGCYFTRVDMRSGRETSPLYGALDAFYAGILALSGDTMRAACIQQGNFHMWTHFTIEPEEFNFRTDSITYGEYPLRPENIESCFYLYRRTGDSKYLRMGKKMVIDILSYTRTNAGFSALKDVRTLELSDSMESFFFAETLKYAWLLFAPADKPDLESGVFNTEAHFMRKEVK
jgi:mannosidase alpha-like ER degradation enhancer 2